MTRVLSIVALATLAACGPHVPGPHGVAGDGHALSAARCGAGNPLCAPGGRPRLISLPDGRVILASPGWAAVKGGF